MPTRGFIAIAPLVFGLVLIGAAGARAEPLGKQACAKLKAEYDSMLTPEMKQALDQGPDWVKSHLDDQDLDKVRAYINIENKLDFRCRKGRYLSDYVHRVPLPDRRPEPPASNSQVVSTSQARAD
jgi:hypothetical protein